MHFLFLHFHLIFILIPYLFIFPSPVPKLRNRYHCSFYCHLIVASKVYSCLIKYLFSI